MTKISIFDISFSQIYSKFYSAILL